MERLETIPEYQKAVSAGQEHVFRFWSGLNEFQRERLLSEIASVDFDLMKTLHADIVGSTFSAPPADELEPVDTIPLPHSPEDHRRDDAARAVGEDALRNNRVAAFLVAGGQGSRLGFSGPKGAFPVGPVTDRTLFGVFAQKIAAIRKIYACRLPWLIMTSTTNHDDTVDFFEARDYFGLGKESFRFFSQQMLPAMTPDGKLILADTDRLFWSPNGHGGSIKALADSGTLAWLDESGITTMFYFQVDNPLVNICDPVYLGHHLAAESDMSCKVIEKDDPFARCGNLVRHKGRTIMIEYSDMPDELAVMRDESGALRFRTGSIAIHVFDIGFLKQLTGDKFSLPYHLARKAIPYVDESGKIVKPTEKNGIKFETFVFDALPMATRVCVVETAQATEFSPVKNASGDASASTCRRDMSRLFASWLRRAGVDVPVDENGVPPAFIELKPTTSLNGEGLEKFRNAAIDFSKPVIL